MTGLGTSMEHGSAASPHGGKEPILPNAALRKFVTKGGLQTIAAVYVKVCYAEQLCSSTPLCGLCSHLAKQF